MPLDYNSDDPSNNQYELLDAAWYYHDLGLYIIPCRGKVPTASQGFCAHDPNGEPLRLAWRPYMYKANPPKYPEPCNIGLVCGSHNNNLEMLDLDSAELFEPFMSKLRDANLFQFMKTCPIIKSRGYRFSYLCPRRPGGNDDLARDEQGKILIETRGEGGQGILPPSIHPNTGKKYILAHGSFASIPMINEEQWAKLLDISRSFNRFVKPIKKKETIWVEEDASPTSKNRPGDDFARKNSWDTILEPHGWEIFFVSGDTVHWTRPEKNSGTSATTNHNDHDILFVFSSNAAPFEAGQGYSKFHAYALLNHNGDFSAASKELAQKGYGIPQWAKLSSFAITLNHRIK